MLYGYLVEPGGFYMVCDLGFDSFFCGIILIFSPTIDKALKI